MLGQTGGNRTGVVLEKKVVLKEVMLVRIGGNRRGAVSEKVVLKAGVSQKVSFHQSFHCNKVMKLNLTLWPPGQLKQNTSCFVPHFLDPHSFI